MRPGRIASWQNLRTLSLGILCSVGMLFLILTSVRAQAVTFTQITTGPLVNTPGNYWGGSWGDYDDDGWLDVFVGSTYASTTNSLYRNNHDGTFTLKDADMPKLPSNQHGAAWADYDNDGHLDLIVTAGNPEPAHSVLYHNNGDGTLSGITTNAIYNDFFYTYAGVHAPQWGDYNNDGLIDLFIAGHDTRNRLFRNDGAGLFTRITNHVLVNGNADSDNATWTDYDNDGDLDFFVANDAAVGPPYINALFRNDWNGVFTRVSNSTLTTFDNTIASCWADYDNDGDLDLFNANAVRNHLFFNLGNGTFSPLFLRPNGVGIGSPGLLLRRVRVGGLRQ